MNRYQRQTILPQIGELGQKALRDSKVLLVGAGGLGLPCAQSLVAAGVGRLTLIDDDLVSWTNLQRQILFCENDLGRAKVEVAKERLILQNSEVFIEGIRERLGPRNARELISKHDLVIDGSDNFATKFLINDACLMEKRPWVYGSVSRFEGQLAVFSGKDGDSCYRCLYEKMPTSKIENCAEQGVLGAVTGIIGNCQALEAIKILIQSRGVGEAMSPQVGVLRVFDLLSFEQQTLVVPKRKSCQCEMSSSIELREEVQSCVLSHGKTWQDFDQDPQEKILFDVRSAAEFGKGHHQVGQLWSDEKMRELKHLTSQKQVSVYLYCFSGKRAQAKCLELHQAGISAFYLQSGLSS